MQIVNVDDTNVTYRKVKQTNGIRIFSKSEHKKLLDDLLVHDICYGARIENNQEAKRLKCTIFSRSS